MTGVATGFRHNGYRVKVSCKPDNEAVNVVFGFYLSPSNLPKDSVIYQMEPFRDDLIMGGNIPVKKLREYKVWDYSKYNIKHLQRYGVRATYVPICHVPQPVQNVSTDIDVMFYGNLNPRRQYVMRVLDRMGLRTHSGFGVYGQERDSLIARSKVVLNIHAEDNLHTFESVRVSHLLSLSKPVISEFNHGDDDDGFRDVVVLTPYQNLVNECLRLVSDQQKQEELKKRGLEFMETRDAKSVISKAVEETWMLPTIVS